MQQWADYVHPKEWQIQETRLLARLECQRPLFDAPVDPIDTRLRDAVSFRYLLMRPPRLFPPQTACHPCVYAVELGIHTSDEFLLPFPHPLVPHLSVARRELRAGVLLASIPRVVECSGQIGQRQDPVKQQILREHVHELAAGMVLQPLLDRPLAPFPTGYSHVYGLSVARLGEERRANWRRGVGESPCARPIKHRSWYGSS